MTQAWTKAIAITAAKSAILSAVPQGTIPTQQNNSDWTILIEVQSLRDRWNEDIPGNIIDALRQCYSAEIIDLNHNWGKEILIRIPEDQIQKFNDDLHEARHSKGSIKR